MKYIKQFELYTMVTNQTEEEIQDICDDYNISNYNINDDMSINVYADVNLSKRGLIDMPLIFNYVKGNFECRGNELTTLKGCPIKVDGSFKCSFNNLTSLEYSPIEVGNDFDCSSNQITSLKYSPTNVDGKIHCMSNPLPIDISYLNNVELNALFKHQEDYSIWNIHNVFNQDRFNIFLKDLEAGELN